MRIGSVKRAMKKNLVRRFNFVFKIHCHCFVTEISFIGTDYLSPERSKRTGEYPYTGAYDAGNECERLDQKRGEDVSP